LIFIGSNGTTKAWGFQRNFSTMREAETHKQVPEEDISSPDIVFRGVLRGLYNGQYVQGQRLVEGDLALHFRVGRGAVREALTRLAAEGVVSISRHRGACVRWLTRDEVLEVLSVMEVLAALAARLAAANIEKGPNRKNLQAALKKLLEFKKSRDFPEFVRARNQFYRVLLQAGSNQELNRIFPTMHVHLVRVQFRTFLTTAERARFKDYQSMADAVLAGDEGQAERITRRHIRRTAVEISQLPDEAFAPPPPVRSVTSLKALP
jgi:DNA-binding GntR family transcriptional regulator